MGRALYVGADERPRYVGELGGGVLRGRETGPVFGLRGLPFGGTVGDGLSLD
jgi:hypothetical protein